MWQSSRYIDFHIERNSLKINQNSFNFPTEVIHIYDKHHHRITVEDEDL